MSRKISDFIPILRFQPPTLSVQLTSQAHQDLHLARAAISAEGYPVGVLISYFADLCLIFLFFLPVAHPFPILSFLGRKKSSGWRILFLFFWDRFFFLTPYCFSS